MNAPIFFQSAGDERGTPQDFFDRLDAEFHFDLDAAAGPANHKCEMYFGFGGIAEDALEEDWGGDGTTVFLNPPYSVAGAFVAKAREEADKGAVVVMLLPVRSDTKWWQGFIWNKDGYCQHLECADLTKYPEGATLVNTQDGNWRLGVRCRFIPGRLSFELVVPPNLRNWIKSEMVGLEPGEDKPKILRLRDATGLPKMAIERILQDQPDDCLLEGAPFPSCVVIFTKA